jgi:mitogen-activated protein kinase 1/3
LPTNEDSRRYIKSFDKVTKKPIKEIFRCISPAGEDFLNRCLQFNPQKRMTVSEALDHPLFDRVRDTAKEVIGKPLELQLELISLASIKERLYESGTIFMK